MQAPQGSFIGDSIIAGHTAHYSFLENNATTNIDSTIEKQFANLTGYTYQNMGIGSQTTNQTSARFIADVIDKKPRFAVLEGGVNDIAGGSITKAQFLANNTTMLDAMQTAGVTALMVKILPWTGGSDAQLIIRDDWNADLETLVDTYANAFIVDAGSYVGQYNINGPVGNTWDIQPIYDVGGVHFNHAGHEKIAEAIADVLKPTVTFDNDFAAIEEDKVNINYNLSQIGDSSIQNISQTGNSGIEYSINGGTNWFDATDAGGTSDGLVNLLGSQVGVNHDFLWDAVTDLGVGVFNNVVLRIRSNDGTSDAMVWTVSNAFDVVNYSISIAKTTDGAEPGTDARFTVTVTPANSSGSAITGDIAYTGTATNGTDYATGAMNFSIADGSSTAVITLDTTDDSLVEGTETIIATISNPSTGSLGTDNATAYLTDDDTASGNVLIQIGNEADDPDTVNSVVTVAELGQILPALTNLTAGNETAYQDYIDANPNSFSSPATQVEVQVMIDAVNKIQSSLKKIKAYAENSSNPVPTVDDYMNVGVTGVNADNLSTVNEVVDAVTENKVDTVAKIQALVEEVLGGNSTSTEVPIYRLYNTKTGVHLYTRGEADKDKILNKFKDFEFTDGVPAFYASIINDGTTPIFRLYNKRTGAHLYTRGEADKDKILNKFKDFEFTDGVPAFYASLTDDGTTPIYRLYNTRTVAHLYVRGEEDRDKILAKWSDFEFTDKVAVYYLRT